MQQRHVWVTGANGHLGYTLVRTLCERGYRVRASVRNPSDETRCAPLRSLGAELVRAELLDPASLEQAAEGMEGVFHAAASFDTAPRDVERDLYLPNVVGTRNVLEACRKAGVPKVIFTSSVAAVGTTLPGEAALDERAWNQRAVEPYAKSKRDAERAAVEFADANGLCLVRILPGTMLGPNFFRVTPALRLAQLAAGGELPMIPPLTFSYVDVRDVADAHVLAFESQNARGRYIASRQTLGARELLEGLARVDASISVPKREVPSSIIALMPVFDALSHLTRGTPRDMTCALVHEYGRRVQNVSSERITRELGWKPRAIEETLRATVQWMAGALQTGASPSGARSN